MTGECGQRVCVVGTSGCGKTTMARKIAGRLDIRHVELDALHWEPDWTPAPRDVFRWRVQEALDKDAWATDGNYSVVRDIVWGHADTVVWLDYGLPLVMWRLLRRSIRRATTGKDLWSGNQETFRRAFFSRDSILLWALQTYHRRRREYPELFALPQHAHLTTVQLRSPREAHAWLSTISSHHITDREDIR